MQGIVNVVVPLAGTWIEIVQPMLIHESFYVVPLAGTWIEISLNGGYFSVYFRRSPCGNVD